MSVYRIRRYIGYAGGSHHYYHADVIAVHWATALNMAKNGKVFNWRWIDTFDICDRNYTYYEYLYRVE